MFSADVSREILLETFDFVAGGQPSGTKGLDDRLDLILADRRLVEGDKLRIHTWSRIRTPSKRLSLRTGYSKRRNGSSEVKAIRLLRKTRQMIIGNSQNFFRSKCASFPARPVAGYKNQRANLTAEVHENED